MRCLSLFLSFISFSAGAQNLFKIKFKDCIKDSSCFYCGDTPAHYKKKLSDRLQFSLDHGLQKWVGTSGRMYFEIEVDSTGQSCVKSIRDDVGMSDVRNTFRQCINGLYDWSPAILNGRPINSTVIVELYFIGYIADVKFIKPGDVK